MAQNPNPENILVVPIKADFLLVKEGDPPLAEAKVDFSRLPYNDGKEDVNTEFAYISENFLSQPFQNNNLFLPPGLHLHWALPDAFTKGKMQGFENNKHVTHTQVPDRWVINRKKNGVAEKSWVVESSYLHPEGKDNKYHSIAYPIEVKETGQPFRYMGRSYCVYDKSIEDKIKAGNQTLKQPSIPSSPDKPDYLDGLTAVGYGEHTFAAFYPNCRSVFGFHDPEIKDDADLNIVEYEVLGWYGKLSNDPLSNSSDSLNFDGIDDNVTCQNIPAITITGQLTIEAWVKPDSKFDINSIVTKKFAGLETPGYAFYINQWNTSNGHLVLETQNAKVETMNPVIYNQWQHVAVVVDGISVTIYINGVPQALTAASIVNLTASSDNLTIGGFYPNAGNYNFKGFIDEVRIWNNARTQEQIKSSMNVQFDSPRDGLVAYYKFNQGVAGADNRGKTTLSDSSGNNNNGILNNFNLTGTTSNWADKDSDLQPGSGALDFDGVDDYIAIGSGTGIPVANSPYTIEALVKPNVAFNGINGIIGWGNFGSQDQFNALWLGAAKEIRPSWWINEMVASVPDLSDGKWYHVAATFDGTILNIFFDGVSIYSNIPGNHNVPSVENFRIGSTNNGEYFHGAISEVRIWNKARTQEQIKSCINVQFDSPQDGLVAYYKFNQGVAGGENTGKSMLTDSSGNSNHGTLSGFGLKGNTSNWIDSPPILNLNLKLKKQFDFSLNVADSYKSDPFSLMTVCYARLKFDRSIINASPNTAIAIGNTGTEALSAFLATRLNSSDKIKVEEELEAIQLLSKVAGKKLDIDAAFDEAYHEKGFSTVAGGHIWSLRVESKSGESKPNSGKLQGAEITLPESFAQWINDINQLQQQHDRAEDELKSLQQLLYSDWCKYMVAAYHPDIEKELPQMDNIRFFIQNFSIKSVDEKTAQISDLYNQINAEVEKINQLILLFNCGFQFGKIVFGEKDNINTTDSLLSKKITAEKYFYPDNRKPVDGVQPGEKIPVDQQDAALEGVYIKKYIGSENGESISINGSVTKFNSISFWINISDHQAVDDKKNAYLRQLIQLSDANNSSLIEETKIDSNGIGSYWQMIYINGVTLNPYETFQWNDFPKDQWIHVYLEGSSVYDQPVSITLMNGLTGSLAGVRVFNEALTSMELFCDMNMLLSKELKLASDKGPRYWQTTEPVVLISGGIAKPSERYGFDDALPCLLLKPDNFTLSMDISVPGFSVKDNAAAFRTMLDSIAKLPTNINTAGLAYPDFIDQAISNCAITKPWNPLILEWKVGVIPLADNAGISGYQIPDDLITGNYILEDDKPDLIPKPGHTLEFDSIKILSGSTILTPHAKDRMMEVIEQYLENLHGDDPDWKIYNPDSTVPFVNPFVKNSIADPGLIKSAAGSVNVNSTDTISLALRAYNILYDQNNHFLSQSLGGFNAALQMLHQTFQLPIADPIGFDDDQKFAADVKSKVERESKFAPLPLFEFDPVRTGKIKLLELNVIDSFGQIQRVYNDGITGNPPVIYSRTIDGGNLPPRIAQPARINFRWLSANSEEMEMNDHPVSSPICGWLVPNNIDDSIMVYDQEGYELGAIYETIGENPAKPYWRSVPGASHPVSIDQFPNDHLKNVVSQLLSIPSITSFMDLLEQTLDQIDPENFAQNTDLVMLIGKPIAIVRASVGLEVKGKFAVNQDWESFEEDMNEAIGPDDPAAFSRITNGWENIKFPVRIGEHGQLNDGVLGYWLDSSPDTFCSTVPAEDTEIKPLLGTNTHSKGFNAALPNITLSPADDPVRMTLLMDPRGKAHGTCGIVPAKLISIPGDQYKPALKNMSVTFFTRPLLMPKGKVAIPLPDEPGYSWSWLVQSENKWVEVATIGIVHKDIFEKTFKNGDDIWNVLIKKGWIEETENNKAIVIPQNRRKDPDPETLLITQLDKIQQLLDAGHIADEEYEPNFSGTNTIKEGWLKLTPIK